MTRFNRIVSAVLTTVMCTATILQPASVYAEVLAAVADPDASSAFVFAVVAAVDAVDADVDAALAD